MSLVEMVPLALLQAGGKIDSNCDMFNSLDISQKRSGNFDAFDHYDDSYQIKVLSKPILNYDVGIDWKQTLLNKAKKLDYYRNLHYHDNNKRLPFEDCTFEYVYSNSAYWVKSLENHISDLFRITKPGGHIILELKTRDAITLSVSAQLCSLLGKESCDILDAGRASTWEGLCNQLEYESILVKNSDVEIIKKEPIYGDILANVGCRSAPTF